MGGGQTSSHQAPYRVKCGRCGVVFATRDCGKLEHFGIYRVVCPHCHWPGRYLASELHARQPAKLTSAKTSARSA
ncbi:MAG: hypothetical protein ACTHJX_12650 [Terriglobales bacterium]